MARRRRGAAVSLSSRRPTQPVSTTGVKFWSQASKGVHGVPEEGDDFGAAFQSLTVAGAAPKFIVSAEGDDQDGERAA